ncbi:MAG TPA: Gfo/Idh/MocA family oxidoreductase [Tepidisphaeraceae bacterium]|nr:Gfo/Idh/MocA family oxidoreductase [Tepidisphaeraceae bacterium]
MSVPPNVRWGIIGTGSIASALAEGLVGARRGKLAAVASRDLAKARAFVAEKVPAGAGVPGGAVTAHGSYAALLADPGVDAVYVAVPHPEHARWAVAAAAAGKHVLCEKPLGMSPGEVEQITAAARRHGVFLMEAFMYRCHPQTARVVELIRAGAIGEVRMIRGSFCFAKPFDAGSRLYDKALGGGGILDVGCYPVSMARLIAGVASGKPFAEPLTDARTGGLAVYGAGHVGASGVDEYAAAVIKFPAGIVAQVACGVAVETDWALSVFGTRGRIEVPKAWIPAREGGEAEIFVHASGPEVEKAATEAGRAPERVVVTTDQQIYGLEADVAAEGILRTRAGGPGAGEAMWPAMTWGDSLGNARVLEAWLGAVHGG